VVKAAVPLRNVRGVSFFLYRLLVGLISIEKRHEFKGPQGCQMISTLLKRIKATGAELQIVYLLQMKNKGLMLKTKGRLPLGKRPA
jgi:hypothetical protein